MNKKIWIDIEEPKTGIMFKSLIEKFHSEGLETLITARDYDSTFQILDELGYSYQKVGIHGGEKLENKLKEYIQRLHDLFPIITKFNPNFFVTFSSVECARISYGLNIPSIGYNDEPRNIPVCKLLFPFLDKIITPKCVPKEWYIKLHADHEKIIRYNGIDEIAWLSEFTPNSQVLEKFDLERGKFLIIRSEPSFASYFVNKLAPDRTLISEFLPSIYHEFPEHKFIVIVRTNEQQEFLEKKLSGLIDNKNIILTRFMPNMVDLCFYSALVISGGGTIVRESSLLKTPSIEYFPGETAPQEQFLIKNGFPLHHIKEPKKIIQKSIDYLSRGDFSNRFDLSFKKIINTFDNPNDICFDYVMNSLNT